MKHASISSRYYCSSFEKIVYLSNVVNIILGENLGVYVINQLSVRTEQRTCSSLSYVLPSDKIWAKDEVLVSTPTKNYSISNFYDYFQDIGFPDGYEMYKDTYNYQSIGLNPPGVEVHCIHGINVTDTIERFV